MASAVGWRRPLPRRLPREHALFHPLQRLRGVSQFPRRMLAGARGRHRGGQLPEVTVPILSRALVTVSNRQKESKSRWGSAACGVCQALHRPALMASRVSMHSVASRFFCKKWLVSPVVRGWAVVCLLGSGALSGGLQ